MNATPKMTKKIRDLARGAYDTNGYLRGAHEDEHAHGSFRSVIVEGGIAIKFARRSSKAAHNRAEWDAWRKLPANIQKITAKPFCISSCGRVMAVELVPKTIYEDYEAGNRDYYSNDLGEFNENLKTLLGASGLFSRDEISSLMVDNHAHNVGVRDNGELCWIDYAGYAGSE